MNTYLRLRELRREMIGLFNQLRPLIKRKHNATPSEKAKMYLLEEKSRELSKQIIDAEIAYVQEKHSPMKSELYKEYKEKDNGSKTLVSMERLKYLRKELAEVITDLANIK